MLRAISAVFLYFFFNDTATTEIYTLSLHDALPIFANSSGPVTAETYTTLRQELLDRLSAARPLDGVLLALHGAMVRSEEHTSELQSRQYLVCRLLLEKKKKNKKELRRSRRQ